MLLNFFFIQPLLSQKLSPLPQTPSLQKLPFSPSHSLIHCWCGGSLGLCGGLVMAMGLVVGYGLWPWGFVGFGDRLWVLVMGCGFFKILFHNILIRSNVK